MNQEELIENCRKNPGYYDELGGYIGPGADLFGGTERPESWYQYDIESSINEGEMLIIQRAKGTDAAATWTVTASSVEANPDDTDANPLESDGCWPEPPAEVIAEARGILGIG